jgi:hypothetical protein
MALFRSPIRPALIAAVLSGGVDLDTVQDLSHIRGGLGTRAPGCQTWPKPLQEQAGAEMPKLSELAEVTRLLERLAAVEEALTPNERELFHSLKAKYEAPGPGAGSFDDRTCLEVMLRNVEIRRGYGLDPQDTVGPIVDLPRKDDAEDA